MTPEQISFFEDALAMLKSQSVMPDPLEMNIGQFADWAGHIQMSICRSGFDLRSGGEHGLGRSSG